MPLDTPHDPVTGEVLEAPRPLPPRDPVPMPDWSQMTDRALLEHIAAQNHDVAESIVALLDVAEALTGTTEQLLQETRGEGEPKKDGKTLQDEVKEFTDAIKALTEEYRVGRKAIPGETADAVEPRFQGVIQRLLEEAEKGEAGTPA